MKTLYRQFIVTILIILLISISLGFLLANFVYILSIKHKIDEQNIEKTSQIAMKLEQVYINQQSIDEQLSFVGSLGYQLYVQSESGFEAYYGAPFTQKDLPEIAMESILQGETYHGSESFRSMFVMMHHFSNDVTNTVGVPFEINGERYGLFLRPNNKLLFSDFHMILLWFIVAIATVSIVGVMLLAKRLTKPITRLTEATKEITRENFNYSLNIERNDEIGELAHSFSRMQRQLQHNDEARKAFISHVSHDFQSPLTNIRGYAELLKSDDLSAKERSEYLLIIDRESKRLSNLTKQLLLLTSLDQKDYPMKLADVQLDEQIKELVRRMQWRLEEHDIEVSYKLMPVTLKADPELMLTVSENLLTNAIKYNKPGGSIHIELSTKGKQLNLLIQDTGIGIEAEALEQIFERFYRVDTARDKDGSGLGLSIVKQIIMLHDGSIEVSSQLGEGTVFQIKLPCYMHQI